MSAPHVMDRNTIALEWIKIEFAKGGMAATKLATRIYLENTISLGAYNKAAQAGLAIYDAQVHKGGAMSALCDHNWYEAYFPVPHQVCSRCWVEREAQS